MEWLLNFMHNYQWNLLNLIWLIDSYSGVQCVHRLVGRGHICQSQCHQEGVASVTERRPLLVSSTTCDRLKRWGPRQVDCCQLLNRGPQSSCKQSNTRLYHYSLFLILVVLKKHWLQRFWRMMVEHWWMLANL